MATELHLVLHGAAIKKHGTVEEIAEVSGLATDKVAMRLATATAGARAVQTDGRYMLSPAGQMIVLAEYSRFYGALRADKAFIDAYGRFELINTELKQLITNWQTMAVAGEMVPNDHTNTEYDEEIIARLGSLHERFEPILANLVNVVPRLKYYRDGLETALDRAEDGEVAWVSDPKIASYHTVWFEMHEDLLRLLGRQREE